jgi:alkanesulfonate monooxygenase SsuD/methylene tetrahydromethanopterin reductase-like flavin-dependent oxidoreductase (luciferase family)
MTVDHVSNGRLELGLGAGWFVPEHEQFGIPFPPPGELVSRFHEAVQVIDALLRHGRADFDGRYYRLRDAHLRPTPLQRPRPPLTLGAHRSRMLRICAEYADGWNSFGTVQEMRERNGILDEHCAALGRDPMAIWRSFYGWAAKMKEQGLPDPWTSTEAFREMVGRYAEAGVNEFIIDAPGPEQFPVLERVAADVLPGLRGGAR